MRFNVPDVLADWNGGLVSIIMLCNCCLQWQSSLLRCGIGWAAFAKGYLLPVLRCVLMLCRGGA